MMHKFPYELNIEHNRLKIRALNPEIVGKIFREANHVNLVIKVIKSYTNCGIIIYCSSYRHNRQIF